VLTAFLQEHRSNQAARALRAMVHVTASVRRSGQGDAQDFIEVPLEQLVPGDIVRLSVGDMIPADLYLLEARDLYVNQSALTGESMPAEKAVHPASQFPPSPFDCPNLCFMGSNVVSGYATGLIVKTGAETFFGRLAEDVTQTQEVTAFDRGINRFTRLMMTVMLVMVPMVFVINGLTKHDYMEALLFALAVAVGLTPEMLPMIVTVNLAKGALAMARKKVIVKRLNAIQNLGAIDILCTDKTGTLTQDTIILKHHLDVTGKESETVLHYAYLNSYFQTGMKNLLDHAVLAHGDLQEKLQVQNDYKKRDEIPFDFTRRRLSVVVEHRDGKQSLITKGAVEEMFAICTKVMVEGRIVALDDSHAKQARAQSDALNADGFRVIAIAYKEIAADKKIYSVADEADLVLLGTIAFLDPPKETAASALAELARYQVGVKVLTGDNDIIARKICKDVGLATDKILLGEEIERLDEHGLGQAVGQAGIFAKLTPAQKERIIRALQSQGHVVGFLGDGINDSPALKAADVGISVDTAVDIAKESADIILLEKSLRVLVEGVVEGRKIFANITKYIRMGASSNLGNMFSVLGASLFLPFLPMTALQILVNNLLYDFSQTTIPTDHVDEEFLLAPRTWDVDQIFKFMICIGPISSLFDYATFALMWFAFDAGTNPALFQSGWFVESLLTQTLIIHIIRTAKIPFIESRASTALIMTTTLICTIAAVLPYSPVGAILGFVPLPLLYWPAILLFLLLYAVLTHTIKSWFIRRYGY
jgi:Mg2+-importing ATPase